MTIQERVFDPFDISDTPVSHHVGAKPLPLPAGVAACAVYGGPLDCYRYVLEWTWDASLPTLMALMMNPSVAGHLCGDMTVAKMWRYGRSWGFGRLLIGNGAAYRATDQGRLAEVDDPVGPDNARHLIEMAQRSAKIVVGYGQPKVKAARMFGPNAARLLTAEGFKLSALRVSANGAPWHPLYVKGDAKPSPWVPPTNGGHEPK